MTVGRNSVDKMILVAIISLAETTINLVSVDKKNCRRDVCWRDFSRH